MCTHYPQKMWKIPNNLIELLKMCKTYPQLLWKQKTIGTWEGFVENLSTLNVDSLAFMHEMPFLITYPHSMWISL
jgi:hypothetical protein